VINNLICLNSNSPEKTSELTNKVNSWELQLCSWTKEWDAYIVNPKSWNTVSFLEFSKSYSYPA
jgi:hypothetical protein